MKIYLEVIILLILVGLVILWKFWYSLSKMRLAKKYKPENDKSRKGGVPKTEIGRTEPSLNIEIESNGGSDESERRELLPATDVDSTRENCTGPGRNSKALGKLLRRNRK